MHPPASDFVDAHKHGLAALPGSGIMLHEIMGNLIQPLVRSNDVVIALKFPFQPLGNINILDFQFLQLPGDPLVDIACSNTQLLPPRIVIQRNGGLVFNGPLKIIGGYIITKPPGRVISSSVNSGVPVKPM